MTTKWPVKPLARRSYLDLEGRLGGESWLERGGPREVSPELRVAIEAPKGSLRRGIPDRSQVRNEAAAVASKTSVIV